MSAAAVVVSAAAHLVPTTALLSAPCIQVLKANVKLPSATHEKDNNFGSHKLNIKIFPWPVISFPIFDLSNKSQVQKMNRYVFWYQIHKRIRK